MCKQLIKKTIMKQKMNVLMLFVICAMSSFDGQAQDAFTGEVKLFAGNFAPRGWAFCDGQVMQITANQALFSLLGNTYGGDGRSTFALPDLRGRVALGPRRGNGLSNFSQGQQGGSQTNTLNTSQLPSHSHIASGVIRASSAKATSKDPTGNYFASAIQVDGRNEFEVFSYASSKNVDMNADAINVTVGTTGSSKEFNNLQPFLAINYIICLNGIYPSRQ
jgi:microcystin-dependent protein